MHQFILFLKYYEQCLQSGEIRSTLWVNCRLPRLTKEYLVIYMYIFTFKLLAKNYIILPGTIVHITISCSPTFTIHNRAQKSWIVIIIAKRRPEYNNQVQSVFENIIWSGKGLVCRLFYETKYPTYISKTLQSCGPIVFGNPFNFAYDRPHIDGKFP